MALPRLTLGKIALAWAVLLWTAALVLPQLGPQAQAHPIVKSVVAVLFSLLLIGTPVALIRYFNRAWRRVDAVPNRVAYVTWLSLETIAGAGLVGMLGYAAITFTVARLR
jgi:hypothetical protein